MFSKKYSRHVKLLVIGELGIGKSCIQHMFANGKFAGNPVKSPGITKKYLSIGDETIKLEIWDSAGLEAQDLVPQAFSRGSSGALMVYDITNRYSFETVPIWINKFRCGALQNAAIVLIGNKVDLADEAREVSYEEARQFATKNGITHFFETSAKTGLDIDDAFTQLARLAVECSKERQAASDPNVIVRNERCCLL